jgi:hypothetical protein
LSAEEGKKTLYEGQVLKKFENIGLLKQNQMTHISF